MISENIFEVRDFQKTYEYKEIKDKEKKLSVDH